MARGIAWCSPPLMLLARRTSPSNTLRAASTVAIATWAEISCIPGKTGLSLVPSPNSASATPRCTAAM